MKTKEILNRLLDSLGPEKTAYIICTTGFGLSAGLLIGLITKEKFIKRFHILEEENK